MLEFIAGVIVGVVATTFAVYTFLTGPWSK